MNTPLTLRNVSRPARRTPGAALAVDVAGRLDDVERHLAELERRVDGN